MGDDIEKERRGYVFDVVCGVIAILVIAMTICTVMIAEGIWTR